jgi:hypothetical protein
MAPALLVTIVTTHMRLGHLLMSEDVVPTFHKDDKLKGGQLFFCVLYPSLMAIY